MKQARTTQTEPGDEEVEPGKMLPDPAGWPIHPSERRDFFNRIRVFPPDVSRWRRRLMEAIKNGDRRFPLAKDEGSTGLSERLDTGISAGPRTSREIWETAQKAALSARTLQRAKRNLGIRCRRIYTDGRPVSYWFLPGQELPSSLSDFPQVAALLAQLGKEFPPRTPLDEDDFDAN